MRRPQYYKVLSAVLTAAFLVLIPSASISPVINACGLTQQSCSAGYGVNEAFFGSGGQLCDPSTPAISAHSTNYCAKTSAGETGVGNSRGTNFQAQAGFNTDRTPSLTFIVGAVNLNLGTLSASTTATTTATFSVMTYLASGYTVVTASDPPSSSGYIMAGMAAPAASAVSTEQFGINLVANTVGCGAPVGFGSNPVQVPSGTFSSGTVAAGYNTCGQFKYVKGNTIAQSMASSGETDYTISYIFNISNVTPAGAYTFNHVLVATSTY